MRLIDLHPYFVGHGGEGVSDKDGNPIPRREGIGIIFDCPKCGPEHPCFVGFENPLDGQQSTETQSPRWHREGDTFDTLTLKPSILRKDCGWHGFITNGEVTT